MGENDINEFWKEEILYRGNLKVIKDFMYFGWNYPSHWIESVWKEEGLAIHLRDKFKSLCEIHQHSGHAYCEFFFELDEENKKKLVGWITDNYES